MFNYLESSLSHTETAQVFKNLASQATGKFPLIEKWLQSQDLEFPEKWNVKDVIVFICICAEDMFYDNNSFAPKVNLVKDVQKTLDITDLNSDTISFRYISDGRVIKCIVPLPGNSYNVEPGIPILMESGNKYLNRSEFININAGRFRENFQEVLRYAVGNK